MSVGESHRVKRAAEVPANPSRENNPGSIQHFRVPRPVTAAPASTAARSQSFSFIVAPREERDGGPCPPSQPSNMHTWPRDGTLCKDLSRRVAARQAYLMATSRAEVHIEVRIERHTPLGVAVDLEHPTLQVRIELVIPTAEE